MISELCIKPLSMTWVSCYVVMRTGLLLEYV
jgi:hypothetical protein